MDDDDPWGEEPAWAKEDNNDGQDNNDEGVYWFGAQHVVALIDCSEKMFETSLWRDNKTTTPMDAALAACQQLSRNRVLQVATLKTGKRDGVGVVLFGCKTNTEDDDDDDDEDTERQSSTQLLVELNQPGVQQIKTLRSCLEDPVRGRVRNIEAEFKASCNGENNTDNDALRTAVQYANKAFMEASFVKSPTVTSKKNPGDAKSIWIFTCKHWRDDNNDFRLAQMMRDVAEGGTEFVLWALCDENADTTPDANNIPNLFHQVIVPTSMEDMMDHITFQGKKPRRVMSMPLLLPDRLDGPGIQIDFYKMIQLQKKPQPKWINQTTKQETERVTQTIVKDTGEVVKTTGAVTDVANDLDRILHFANFGTDRVPMTPEDVAAIKKGSNSGTETPSLILMGFKPLDSLSMAQTVLDDKTYFIYPNNDDDNDNGSSSNTVAFANLHAAMLQKGVVGIGELLTRVTATSRMVAILAQQQQVDEYDDQVVPPGMLVVSLPFEDDVRAMGPDKNPEVEANDDELLVQAAMDLMQHQTLEGVEIGTNFDNAAIDRFWTYLEAVALETTIPPKQDYETELNEEAVLQVAGAQIATFRDLLPVDVKQEKTKAALPRKRKATVADESGMDWVELYNTNALSECKMDDLKSYLRSVGARLGGKKDDLTFRVSQSIAERIQAGTI